MHWFMRPNAAMALEEDGVKKALGRYARVAKDELPARFLIARSIPVSFDSSSNLWELHSRAVEDYRGKREEIDRRALSPEELEPAENSLIDLKLALARRILESCTFCERRCGVNRLEGKRGFCGLTSEASLSSEFIHLGEEACLVPSHTFFFIGCTFGCAFCQNWTISRRVERGYAVRGEELARLAKARRLVDKSRNINLVGGEPTPNLHVILEMLATLEVNVPVVWNSNMYMSSETMELLEGVVDVYLTDFKYGNDSCAARLSKVKDYTRVAKRNHLLAKEQAELLIRHLVLPSHLECCSFEVLKWIAEKFGNKARVNIMGQYRPEYKASRHPEIARRVTGSEVMSALKKAEELNLTNLD